MKLGYVSALFPDFSLNDILAHAASEGLDTVELMAWPVGKAERKFAGVTHVEVADFNQGQADEVLALAAKHGVGISALGYYPNVLDPDPAVSERTIAHLKKVIAAAPLLGLDRINTFIGRDWHLRVDDNWPRFLEVWRPLIRLAEDLGVKVAIENCPMLFTRDEWPGGKNLATTPAIWQRMFSDIPSPNFGLNYDPAHLIFRFMDPIAPLRNFREKLFHLHAKDAVIHRDQVNQVGFHDDPVNWHEGRIPGNGEMDWSHFMGVLKEVGYDGAVCIEVEDHTFGGDLEGRKAALHAAAQHLHPYFP